MILNPGSKILPWGIFEISEAPTYVALIMVALGGVKN
jgi:hypothetical protein